MSLRLEGPAAPPRRGRSPMRCGATSRRGGRSARAGRCAPRTRGAAASAPPHARREPRDSTRPAGDTSAARQKRGPALGRGLRFRAMRARLRGVRASRRSCDRVEITELRCTGRAPSWSAQRAGRCVDRAAGATPSTLRSRRRPPRGLQEHGLCRLLARRRPAAGRRRR